MPHLFFGRYKIEQRPPSNLTRSNHTHKHFPYLDAWPDYQGDIQAERRLRRQAIVKRILGKLLKTGTMEPCEDITADNRQNCGTSAGELCETQRPNVVHTPNQVPPSIAAFQNHAADRPSECNADQGPVDPAIGNGGASGNISAERTEDGGATQERATQGPGIDDHAGTVGRVPLMETPGRGGGHAGNTPGSTRTLPNLDEFLHTLTTSSVEICFQSFTEISVEKDTSTKTPQA